MKIQLKLLMVIFLTLLIATNIYAEERSYDEMNNVALNFAKKTNNSAFKIADQRLYTNDLDSDKHMYRIINLKPKGWVIVSKDDLYTPIIGYNLDENIDLTGKLPEQFKAWMNGIDEDIRETIKHDSKDEKKLEEWNELSAQPEVFSENILYESVPTKTVQKGPLIANIKWNQSAPYWDLTPTENGKHTLVGCVATAFAQIMVYHSWPSRGTGSYAYTHQKYGKLSVNLDTSYNWNNITNADKAKISYHLGVTTDMDYGLNGSGAWPKTSNWRKFFKYDMTNLLSKEDYPSDKWISMIKKNIDQGLPINYVGFSTQYGHSFVLDGYKFSADKKMYSFNWGWGGYANGWFALGGEFNKRQSAIYDIKPHGNGNIQIPTAPSDLKASSITTNSATLTWKDNSNNEQGFKLYKGLTYVKTVKANATSTKLIGLEANTTNTYNIKAYNSTGVSGATKVTFKTKTKNENIQIPTAPSDLKASSITTNSATLTWKDNSNNEQGFKLYKGLTYVKTVKANATSTKLIGLEANTTNTYNIKAYNSAGVSGATKVTFKTKADDVVTKSIITSPQSEIIRVSPGNLKIRWENHGATRVELYVDVRVHGKDKRLRYDRNIKGTSATVKVPSEFTTTYVHIHSYNARDEYLGYSIVYLNPKK